MPQGILPSSRKRLYVKNDKGTFDNISNDEAKIENRLKSALKMKITGVIKPKNENGSNIIKSNVAYTKALTDYLFDYAENSEVVKAQKENKDINVLNGLYFKAETNEEKLKNIKNYIESMSLQDKIKMITSFTRSQGDSSQFLKNLDIEKMNDAQLNALIQRLLARIGNDVLTDIYDKYISTGSFDDNLKQMGVVNVNTPSSIDLYAYSFESKDGIAKCIEEYNKTAAEEDKIVYTDFVGLLMSSVTTIINIISYVLIAFVAVSLIVSSIMIGIITYISVLERTKEIGILRAIGASKRNISRVFNAETFIIGLFSGVMGIAISLLMLFPINAVIHAIAENDNVNAFLPVTNALILIALSILLTLIGGIIPSRKAAKKDPVTALRTE